METTAKRDAWVVWLGSYGAAKFYDAFMQIAQGAESVCIQCGEPIYLDIREGGGVPDWGMAFDEGAGLDYGCIASPDSNKDGTGGHVPQKHYVDN